MDSSINFYLVLGVLFIHWVGDFVLQTDKQAKGKSSNWNDLLLHTFNYSMIWLIPCLSYSWKMFLFVPITFVCHTIQDYYTSRVNKTLWESGNVHGFFVSVGLDQFLHLAQLLITIQLLK